MAAKMKVVEYGDGKDVIPQGCEVHNFYIVKSGALELSVDGGTHGTGLAGGDTPPSPPLRATLLRLMTTPTPPRVRPRTTRATSRTPRRPSP